MARRWALLFAAGAAASALAWAQSQGSAPSLEAPLLPGDSVVPLMDAPLLPQQPAQGGPDRQGAQAASRAGNKTAASPAATPPQRLDKPQHTRALCDAALQRMAQMQIAAAFELLAPHWPLPERELAQLAAETEGQLRQLLAGGGKILGHEWVRSRQGGKSVVQHLYLLKLQHHGLRVACTFYKPQAQWQVHTVFWDEQIESLLEP
ncbi:hypothetical protein [Vandammella animalimorsus]|uniref:Uncharacterized protein n=1 Tax=Vandammella animalimorsus TaxID=2029117 RepID=A0A2A2AHH3_9BURK|nr:hypothetical protein [Vandammella animalimorsus]PAT37227.1 hypothetical protein CK625_06275 [Vandammella animalimorsus]